MWCGWDSHSASVVFIPEWPSSPTKWNHEWCPLFSFFWVMIRYSWDRWYGKSNLGSWKKTHLHIISWNIRSSFWDTTLLIETPRIHLIIKLPCPLCFYIYIYLSSFCTEYLLSPLYPIQTSLGSFCSNWIAHRYKKSLANCYPPDN